MLDESTVNLRIPLMHLILMRPRILLFFHSAAHVVRYSPFFILAWYWWFHVRSTVQRDDGRPVSHPSGGWEKWALFNSSTNQTRDPDADREGHCSSDALISFSDLCMEALMATSLLCVHDHWLCLCSPCLAIHRSAFLPYELFTGFLSPSKR